MPRTGARSRSLWRLEQAIADAGFITQDQARAELLAQVVGVDPQVLGLAVPLLPPDFAQQLALGDDFAGMAGVAADLPKPLPLELPGDAIAFWASRRASAD